METDIEAKLVEEKVENWGGSPQFSNDFGHFLKCFAYFTSTR